ncbi:hypothetical protein EYF80_062419 [Liparis tanakae]|uniref:Uncharacterized protein n=1 Tax=Liparis tanakae TaxID=230148 RepID=A0A4Z2EEX8_9TELE|nr:hypothetical protein EYF80_062419 [Liparis tanakae]
MLRSQSGQSVMCTSADPVSIPRRLASRPIISGCAVRKAVVLQNDARHPSPARRKCHRASGPRVGAETRRAYLAFKNTRLPPVCERSIGKSIRSVREAWDFYTPAER